MGTGAANARQLLQLPAYSPHLGCHRPASLDRLDRPQTVLEHAVAFAAGRAW